MKPNRILLPLDIRKCPLEIFKLVEGLAHSPNITLIMLHVIPTQPERRKSRQSKEMRGYLKELAERYVHPAVSVVSCIREGEPAKEILEEANAQKVQLIILPTYGPSVWERLASLWNPTKHRMFSPLAEKVIRESNCGVFLAAVKGSFNCQKRWSRGESELYATGWKSKQLFPRWTARKMASLSQAIGRVCRLAQDRAD